MPLRLVLVRHGLSSFNREHRIQGRDDLSTLTDDGAALRLAVKLNITVQPGFAYTPTGKLINYRDHANRTAATRRAIVRAAAEIGRKL